jgi:hypothetical protein
MSLLHRGLGYVELKFESQLSILYHQQHTYPNNEGDTAAVCEFGLKAVPHAVIEPVYNVS